MAKTTKFYIAVGRNYNEYQVNIDKSKNMAVANLDGTTLLILEIDLPNPTPDNFPVIKVKV